MLPSVLTRSRKLQNSEFKLFQYNIIEKVIRLNDWKNLFFLVLIMKKKASNE